MTPTQRRVRLTASIGLQAGLSALIAVGCYGSVGDDAYSGPTGPWAGRGPWRGCPSGSLGMMQLKPVPLAPAN